jgi:hypothetical protein
MFSMGASGLALIEVNEEKNYSYATLSLNGPLFEVAIEADQVDAANWDKLPTLADISVKTF